MNTTSHPPPTDATLVAHILKRDVQAFETLLDRYEAMIRRHVAHILRDELAAQDVTQEVFWRVWKRAEQWSGAGSFKAWLYRIATNLALNHLRTVKRRREESLEVKDDWERGDDDDSPAPAWMVDASALGPDAAVELAEQRETLRRLVANLPPEKHEVFRLVHEMELSMRDAADELGISEGTVKSRLYHARQRLARDWQGLKNEQE